MIPIDSVLQMATDQVLRAGSDATLRPEIASFFDPATFTVSYVVHDPATLEAGREKAVDVVGKLNRNATWLATRGEEQNYRAVSRMERRIVVHNLGGSNLFHVP